MAKIIPNAERQWRRLALAQEKLLACYRLHSRPTDAVLETIAAAKKLLREIGEMK